MVLDSSAVFHSQELEVPKLPTSTRKNVFQSFSSPTNCLLFHQTQSMYKTFLDPVLLCGKSPARDLGVGRGDLGGTLSPGLSGSNAAGPLRPHLTEFDLGPRALTVTSGLEFDLEFDLNKLRAYSRPSWIQSCSAESPRRGTLVSAGGTWAGRSLRAAPGRMLSGHSDRT